MSGMGSHQSAKMINDEWLTPPEIVRSLGIFDLDPCAPIARPWDTAKRYYTINDDGLEQQWRGRVWMNPPYGEMTDRWMYKLANHGNGIALIFARTETRMFVLNVWERADAVMFLHGRLYFHHVDGTKAKANSGAPSCLVAYGYKNIEALERSGLSGTIVKLRGSR